VLPEIAAGKNFVCVERTKYRMRLVTILCLLLLTGVFVRSEGATRKKPAAPVVGWHDEMNDPAAWELLGLENQPAVYAARPGALTLRLPHVPAGFPYAYQWSGVTRTAVVDLDRYPVAVAYVPRLGDGSYAHLDFEERDYQGRTLRTARSSTLQKPGLSVLDLGKEWGMQTQRVVMRLIVGGQLSGAWCEYAWVRFVRREDLPRLEANPGGLKVVSEYGEQVHPSHPAPPVPVAAARRIAFHLSEAAGDVNRPRRVVAFFVNTGSLAPPIVTLADNGGFPEVQAIYAREQVYKGRRGVVVHLVLAQETAIASDPSFAMNVWQPDMRGDGGVIPYAE
jgi:hypothetical protein